MDSLGEILHLCRLCLVKDHVNIPIFDDPGNIRQIPLKISSCLPVQISRNDNLPKKICDGCSEKLDLCYEFWNSSAIAEKKLLSMVAEKENQIVEPPVPQPILMKAELVPMDNITSEQVAEEENQSEPLVPQPIVVKQEAEVLDTFESSVERTEETEAPPSKRPRRSAAIKAQKNIVPESDDDDDDEGAATEDINSEEPLTKEEPYVDEDIHTEVPDMSVDDAQPGTSGLNQGMEDSTSNSIELPQFSANDLTLLMDLKFSTDIPEDLMRIASEWGSAGLSEPNDVVYIVLEEEPVGSSRQASNNVLDEHCIGSKNFESHHSIPVKYRCQQCFVEFDELQQLEYHVTCHQIISAKDADCIEWASKIDKDIRENTQPKSPLLDSNVLNSDASLGDTIQFEPTDLELLSLSNVNCETFQSILENIDSEEQALIDTRVTFNVNPQEELEAPDSAPNVEIGEKSYDCKHCGKIFSRGFLLREHLKDAVKQNPFICEQCGVCFSNRENLKNHLPVHSEETFYSCKDCGKTFRQRGYLKSHIRTHTGEKPFNCQVCGKSFTQKSNLNIHLKGHTGGKPHSCKYCGECFAYKMMLNSHLKSHI